MASAIGPSRRIAKSPHYRWWVYGAIAIGMFLTVMDQTGVNIALPRIAEHFSADIPAVQWITLSYVLSTSAMLMPMGRLSDMVGRKPVYVVGFLVFIGAAALGGFSSTLIGLIAAKIVQGVGAAAIQANGMAMILEVFPDRERGKALGLYMAIIGTGSISGPIIGGLLVSGLGWRWIFFASIPVGLMALVAAAVVLKGPERARAGALKSLKFDWAGATLSSSALISLLLSMTNAHRAGWDSPPIVAGLAIAAVLVAAFLWWERRTSDPMLDLSLFRMKVFTMGVSARFLSFLAGSSVFFLMPFYLMQGLGYPASRAALIMVPGSICMAVIGPISGRLSDKVGTRWLAATGMALSSAGMFLFSRLSVDSAPIDVVSGMILSGSGFGMFSASNTSAIMSSLSKDRYGIVSAFLNLTRTSANLTGVAVAVTIVTLTMASLGHEPSLAAVTEAGGDEVRGAFVSGMSRAFFVAGCLMVLAMVLSALRGEAAPVDAPTPERAWRSRASRSEADE